MHPHDPGFAAQGGQKPAHIGGQKVVGGDQHVLLPKACPDGPHAREPRTTLEADRSRAPALRGQARHQVGTDARDAACGGVFLNKQGAGHGVSVRHGR